MSVDHRVKNIVKCIFHVDMDAFFVSVEELYDPSLIGKPVIVGGRKGDRGVVSAASYAARKFGVHSAMPLRTAAKLCPQGIFVPGSRERYSEASIEVRKVLDSFTPLVEMASIDEAYLDMTGTERLHGPPLEAAHRLHNEMKRRTRLNCSVGVSASRLVSKVASDQAKPNGVLWILRGEEARFLAPLDVRKIPGVGQATEANLHKIGIRRVGDLARFDEGYLADRFGKWGLALAGKSKGLDAGGWFDAEIGAHEGAKSISHEHTYSEDSADANMLESTLMKLAEMVARRLRDHGLHTRTIQIKLRYSDFTTITRARTLDQATQVDKDLILASRDLFRANWQRGRKVRLLGVQASSLTPDEGQLNLLDAGQHEKWRKALTAVDKLRDRYGDGSVALAGGMPGNFQRRIHEGKEHEKKDE